MTLYRKIKGRLISTLFVMLFLILLCGCSREKKEEDTKLPGLLEKTENVYAREFSIEHYEEGYRRIRIGEQSILLIPEGKTVPEGVSKDTVVLRQPVQRIYMASSSAMSFFVALNRLDSVEFTSTTAADWTDETVRKAVYDDRITFVGKYNAPDYEWLLSENCGFAVENTMILHDPSVKEKLEQLGIPVMIERSSYEKHPMGRLEWVKVYGAILGCEEEAGKWFAEQDRRFRELERPSTGTKIAYFSFSTGGYVNVQRPAGYFAEMIRLAGGDYAYTAENLNAEEGESSTMHLSRDQFYRLTKDADVLIYNGSIYGNIPDLDTLLKEEPLMQDFEAVRSGRVYCTRDNLFQEPTRVTELLSELISIIDEKEYEEAFLYRLK